jgi:hypothetical protein
MAREANASAVSKPTPAIAVRLEIRVFMEEFAVGKSSEGCSLVDLQFTIRFAPEWIVQPCQIVSEPACPGAVFLLLALFRALNGWSRPVDPPSRSGHKKGVTERARRACRGPVREVVRAFRSSEGESRRLVPCGVFLWQGITINARRALPGCPHLHIVNERERHQGSRNIGNFL